MSVKRIAESLIGLVPNWYQAECEPESYSLPIGNGDAIDFRCLRKRMPNLRQLHDEMRSFLREAEGFEFVENPAFVDVALEHFALWWLRLHDHDIQWPRVLSLLSKLERRTYENLPVTVNLMISDGRGSISLDSPEFQKFFDQLATSPFTYFRVDRELRLLSYENIGWDAVKDAETYRFHPEFIHPFHSVLKESQGHSVHLTSRGDTIVMNPAGMIASKRKGLWKVYDSATLKNTLGDCVGDYYVGCNMYELVFDLSFKRHGALLVYDPGQKVISHINTASRVPPTTPAEPSTPQEALADSIRTIAIGEGVGGIPKKRLLEELASIDGAVVFDSSSVLAVGAIIDVHPDVGNQLGARTTAAVSAFKYGGRPVKVSSDGEVTVYFTSQDPKTGEQCDARIEFL